MSGDNIGFVDEAAVKAALDDVRSDATDTNWCLFSYENPKSNKLTVVGTGSGGLDELVSQLKDDMVGYGLVRRSDKIDDSVTVKFGFIQFVGENTPRMQKARISVHAGSVRKFIGQYHVDISATETNELSDQILAEKIQLTSGSGSRVIDRATGERTKMTSSSSQGSSTPSGKGATALEFANASELKDAIGEVRKGSADWVLFSYEGNNSNTIVLTAKGTGSADDLLSNLTDEMVGYALVRRSEKIDMTDAIKFVFIRFVGDEVPRMLKARLGTHFGEVTQFFSPYHVSLDVTRKSEISDDIIMNAITSASGTKVNVLKEENNRAPQAANSVVTGQRAAPKATSTNTTKVPAAPKQATDSVIKFVDKDAVLQDIKDVRNDVANWCLVGYEGKKGNTIVSLGKGTGGVSELVEHLSDDIAAYGLVRKVDKIDESLTVKFAFINWLGESTDRMHRARLGTHKGAISEGCRSFKPYLSSGILT
eukprot:TRINITY_DN1347_c0_g1_i2.p1 TRINITY_DN1347_c0_g1~~TRINITY_DN1347_c0_g1_i2.p1  ORF type:complete len:534 (-),score=115.80 TRINITY_DN1347_c0_g1_i2:72-1511(-)